MDPFIAKKRAKHPVLYYPPEGTSSRGDAKYGEPSEHKAFQVKKITFLRTREGQEVQSNIRLYIDGLLAVELDGLVQFEGKEQKHRVLSFEAFEGLREGTGTTVIYL